MAQCCSTQDANGFCKLAFSHTAEELWRKGEVTAASVSGLGTVGPSPARRHSRPVQARLPDSHPYSANTFKRLPFLLTALFLLKADQTEPQLPFISELRLSLGSCLLPSFPRHL